MTRVDGVAVVAATGPSICIQDLDYARSHGAAVICINNAWELAPWADHLYAADVDWWRVYGQKVRDDFSGRSWTADQTTAAAHGIGYAPVRTDLKWSTGLPLASGGNSGFQGVGLAAFLGFRKIVLIGFDFGFKPGTPKHFFGHHPRRCDRPSNYADWSKRWAAAMPLIRESGVDLINASRETALTCMKRANLKDVL